MISAFQSKGFININEPSWAVGQVFKPYSVFTDKEIKALAQVQSFQKQKLLLRALLDTQHQTSEGIDFTIVINVDYTLFTSAKLDLNMHTQNQQDLLKIQLCRPVEFSQGMQGETGLWEK